MQNRQAVYRPPGTCHFFLHIWDYITYGHTWLLFCFFCFLMWVLGIKFRYSCLNFLSTAVLHPWIDAFFFSFSVKFCNLRQGVNVSQAGLKHIMQLKIISPFCSSCLSLPRAGMTGRHAPSSLASRQLGDRTGTHTLYQLSTFPVLHPQLCSIKN